MSIDISIIIVNYNVKAFLKQCLFSVRKAEKKLKVETFVIDNNSVDGSIEMLKEEFPNITLIANQENVGFAKACNQAIIKAKGKFILLLNPDTVIREDSLTSCFEFMNNNKKAGALGVKMINGKGEFLPESKRSLPTAKSAFFKIFGLSALFPKSKVFGKYQLKYLNKDEIHEVEVLSGAFMFIRKSILDKIGYLDEAFFMYGEDIDLSYRILQAGYKNYYFPQTTIIHYKGESTKKASIKYVKIFYNAMLIFANKHNNKKSHHLYRLIIRLAIYFRAVLAILNRTLKNAFLPVLDFLSIYCFYILFIPFWENYKFDGSTTYNPEFIRYYVPVYIIIWQINILYFSGYKLKTTLNRIAKAIFLGTIIILSIYSLLPENYRYSRALILFGTTAAMTFTFSFRIIIRLLTSKPRKFNLSNRKRALLIGNLDKIELEKNANALKKHYNLVNHLKFSETDDKKKLNKIIENINIYKVETIVFFMDNISPGSIINTIISIANKPVEFKIMLPQSNSLVGAKSVIDINEMPQFNISPITSPLSKLKKRLLDIILCLFFVALSPVFLTHNSPIQYFNSIWKVFINKLTWVSYMAQIKPNDLKLPIIKSGVFPLTLNENFELIKDYVKNYKTSKDIIAIFKALKSSLNLQNFK